MSTNNRELTYSLAINEAITQSMFQDDNMILLGQGVKSPWYVGNTCKDLIKNFGEERVIDTPISENAMTGAAIGAAIAGTKSIIVHPRVDFALYAFDPIINQAANWHYMNGGQGNVPTVIWLVINRGGEQAAQHSQALHALFCHIPGLKVIAPSKAYDVKGLLTTAINDPNPVVFIDDRWLYGNKEIVPETIYEIPIGKGVIRNEGQDISLISFSYAAKVAETVTAKLEDEGISVDLIDLRTIKPLDKELILDSVKKTGKVVIIDGAWKTNSVASEVSAIIAEEGYKHLKAPIKRICLPDTPAPASRVLEEEYYLDADKIEVEIKKYLNNN